MLIWAETSWNRQQYGVSLTSNHQFIAFGGIAGNGRKSGRGRGDRRWMVGCIGGAELFVSEEGDCGWSGLRPIYGGIQFL